MATGVTCVHKETPNINARVRMLKPFPPSNQSLRMLKALDSDRSSRRALDINLPITHATTVYNKATITIPSYACIAVIIILIITYRLPPIRILLYIKSWLVPHPGFPICLWNMEMDDPSLLMGLIIINPSRAGNPLIHNTAGLNATKARRWTFIFAAGRDLWNDLLASSCMYKFDLMASMS